MKLTKSLAPAIIAFVVLFQAHGQSNPTPDPYRNFVGHWLGVVKVNPTHMPPQADLTITESKDGKKMIWSYVFGTKGQEGYAKDSKTIVLQPAKQLLISQWQDQDPVKFITSGLDEFVRAGYGKIIAVEVTGAAATAKIPTSSVTFELQSSTLSYTWATSKDGTTSTYSYFDFKRTSVPIATTR